MSDPDFPVPAPQAAANLPRDAVLPDYGDGGLYGLARDLRTWLHEPEAGWAQGGVAPGGDNEVVVVLLIDGLGDEFLATHGAGSSLLAHRRRSLSSVFPSTTASALTTLMTGLSPAQHGLNGWFIRDRRFGGIIAPLPLIVRGNGPIEAWLLAPRLFPYASMFHRSHRATVMLSPAAIARSRYSQRHARGAHMRAYQGLDELQLGLVDEARQLRRCGGLVLAYCADFDALSHAYGTHSEQAVAMFWRLDHLFAAVLDALAGSGVTLVVTADHGFIDVPAGQDIVLPAAGEVAAMLAAPLFGERRAAFCALRPGAEAAFFAWAQAELAGKAVAMRAVDLLASGLLGPGRAHPRLAERVGDCVLLMEPGWTLGDRVEGESLHRMIGVHGGLSAAEMRVPLVCVRV